MSLPPHILDDSYSFRPSRVLDQRFTLGLDPEHLLVPINIPQRILTGYFRPWRSAAAQYDIGSIVQFDKDRFRVNLDVQHFTLEEITVKITGDNTITVEGKHEEKKDQHGLVSRQFVRKYIVPKVYDMQKVVSCLSSDGVLSIVAPRLVAEGSGQRAIPIQQTGISSKSMDGKKEEKTVDVN